MGGRGSGRKAKPVEQHLSEGTYNPTRHKLLDPHKRSTGTAPLAKEPPEYLDGYARDVWETLYPQVTTYGIVTESERELFAAYCLAAGTLRRASDELSNGPIVDVVKMGKGDGPAVTLKGVSPWYEVQRNAMSDVAKLGAQLGLTCVDRSKVLKAKTGGAGAPGALPKTRPRTALDMGGPLKIASTFEDPED